MRMYRLRKLEHEMPKNDVAMVTLRTGEEVPMVTLETFMRPLLGIYQNPNCPMAFYELVKACQDDNHVVFGSATRKLLTDLSFFESVDESGRASIHGDVRRVVLASSADNALEMVSPLPAAPTS